jgi:hypothetical protein
MPFGPNLSGYHEQAGFAVPEGLWQRNRLDRDDVPGTRECQRSAKENQQESDKYSCGKPAAHLDRLNT